MNDHATVVRESPLRHLLRRHGISQSMLDAVAAALSGQKRSSPFQYRTDILISALLGAGIYVLAAVAGNRPNPYLALAAGLGLVGVFKLIDRSTSKLNSAGCEPILFHTRFGIDFPAFARELQSLDPALTSDLRDVLQIGVRDPDSLTNLSILHLWECIRVRMLEFETPISSAPSHERSSLH